MARIKKADKNRSVSSKDLSDHLVGESTLTQTQASVDIAGFTGEQDLEWKAKQGEVHSDVKLEDDLGYGKKVVLRVFDFKANPVAFKHQTPSKQELFNSHAKDIEMFLWKDGLVAMPEVKPQIKLSKSRTHYRIVVGAEPRMGQQIHDVAHTLKELKNEGK